MAKRSDKKIREMLDEDLDTASELASRGIKTLNQGQLLSAALSAERGLVLAQVSGNRLAETQAFGLSNLLQQEVLRRMKRRVRVGNPLGFGAPDLKETESLLKTHREALREEKKRLKGGNWVTQKLAEREIKDIEATIKRLEVRRTELRGKSVRKNTGKKNPRNVSVRKLINDAMK